MDIILEIQKRLFDLADADYKKFHSKLMPTVDEEVIIGVRTPKLRLLSKELVNDERIDDFLNSLPHQYYEENNLHAFLIEQIKDYDECMNRLEKFLPFVDNWATCDMMRPKCFKKHKNELLHKIWDWISSNETYTVRYGIEMLMMHFLDDEFDEEYLDAVSKIRSTEYYINMMIAWYFATALAKQPEVAAMYIEEKRLPDWVHNKTIQKAVESYRIDRKMKEYLKKLRIKTLR